MLTRRVRSMKDFSLPIKENGDWIDNQDISLWHKRASEFMSENPVALENLNDTT